MEGQIVHRSRAEAALRGCDCRGDLPIGAGFYGKSKRTKEWQSNRKSQSCKRLRQSASIHRGRSPGEFPEKVVRSRLPHPPHPAVLCSVPTLPLRQGPCTCPFFGSLCMLPTLGALPCVEAGRTKMEAGILTFAQLFENTKSSKQSTNDWSPWF